MSFLHGRYCFSSFGLCCDSHKHLYHLCIHNVSISMIRFSGIHISMLIMQFWYILNRFIKYLTFYRKEARNSFNLLIVALTFVDLVFCVLLMSDYSFVRSFGLSTATYTIMYPHVLYPAVNITMTASIYMTIVLALER